MTLGRSERTIGAEPRWLSAEEQHAWRTFMDGSTRLMSALTRDLQQDNDLTLSDYRILVLLSEAPGRSLRMSDLADGVDSSRSRLTHQIRRMETSGWVERDSCVEDGRGVVAILTDAGYHVLETAAPSHLESVRGHMIDLLTEQQIRVLGEIFERVETALRDEGTTTD